MTCGYYRTSSPVTALPMIMRWISDVPSKIVKILAAWVPVFPAGHCGSHRRSGVSVRQTPSHRIQAHRPLGARVMIADAVRYMSVDSCREPDSAGLRWTTPAIHNLAREPENAQATGRFRRWWQVLGSNQRRLSRRFYRPLIIRSVCPLRVSPCGGSSDTTPGSAAQPIPVPSCTGCGNDNHGRGHRAKICTP
jgi:hypothetical protein